MPPGAPFCLTTSAFSRNCSRSASVTGTPASAGRHVAAHAPSRISFFITSPLGNRRMVPETVCLFTRQYTPRGPELAGRLLGLAPGSELGGLHHGARLEAGLTLPQRHQLP